MREPSSRALFRTAAHIAATPIGPSDQQLAASDGTTRRRCVRLWHLTSLTWRGPATAQLQIWYTVCSIAHTQLLQNAPPKQPPTGTDSILVLKPRWRQQEHSSGRGGVGIRLLPVVLGSKADGGTNQQHYHQHSGSTSPQQAKAPQPPRLLPGSVPPPPMLRFETWHCEGPARLRLDLVFHVATSELVVRSDDGFEGE